MNKKKLLALLMALVMTLTLVPVTAFAEGAGVTYAPDETGKYVESPDEGAVESPASVAQAMLGEDYYDTLQHAIDASTANNNQITLLRDVDGGVLTPLDANTKVFAVKVGSGKDVVLDLAGYTISAQMNGNNSTYGMAHVLWVSGGKLTINDSSDGKTGAIVNAKTNSYWCSRTVRVADGGTLIMNAGSVTAYSGVAMMVYGGHVTLNEGVTVQAVYPAASLGSPSDGWDNSTSGIEMRGGNSSLTINGATVISYGRGGLFSDNSTDDISITDGVICGFSQYENAKNAINGSQADKTVKATGGYFNSDPTSYIDTDAYLIESDCEVTVNGITYTGMYHVAPIPEREDVTATTYEQLKNALSTATDANPVNVIVDADITISEPVRLGSSSTMTINSGKTVSIVDNGIFYNDGALTNNGSIVVTGSGYLTNPTLIGGSGTMSGYPAVSNGTYTVQTPMDLQWLSYLNKDSAVITNVAIAQNLTMPSSDVYGTVVIEPINYFSGIFDGKNHTIANLALSSTSNRLGLFIYLRGGEECTYVQNLTLNETMETATGFNGGIAAQASGKVHIVNVHMNGSINVSGAAYGTSPFVGYSANNGAHLYIADSSTSMTVNAPNGSNVGFAVGTASNDQTFTLGVYNFTNTGSLTAAVSAGTVIGYIYGPQPETTQTNPTIDIINYNNAGTAICGGSPISGYVNGGRVNIQTQYASTDYTAYYHSDTDVYDINPPVTYVAEIGSAKYETLEAAFANAQDGDTITLLADCAGNGIVVPQGKFPTGLTVDFGGFTYDISGKPVGSTGTETIGMQLLKGNKLNFKNGKLYSDCTQNPRDGRYLLRLIQNYSDLTLDNMTISMKGAYYNQATMSTCNGTTNIINGSVVEAPDFTDYEYSVAQAAKSEEQDGLGAVALLVGTFNGYTTAAAANFSDSTIVGNVQVSYSNSNSDEGGAILNLNNAVLTDGSIVMGTNADKATVTKAESSTVAAPEGYTWSAAVNGVKTLVKQSPVAKIGDVEYTTLAAAIAAANVNGGTVTLLRDYDMEANEPGYGYTTLSHSARENFLVISGDVTFDLGGHTLSNLFNNTFKITGNVTVQNGEMRVGQYTTGASCSYVMMTGGGATLTVNNLTTFGGINVAGGSTATINDLAFSGTLFYAVCSQENSTVTINGGTFNKAVPGAANNLFWVESGSTMNITSGNYVKGETTFLNGKVTPVITGGTFDFDPTNYGVADGYEAVALTDENEGKWQVGKVKATDLAKQDGATDTSATYTATKSVVDTQTGTEIAGSNAISYSITVDAPVKSAESTMGASKETVKLSNIKDNEVVAVAVDKADEREVTSASVEVQLAKSAAKVEKDANEKVTAMTYEVHPEAIITVSKTNEEDVVTTVALSNDQITGSFSFKLYVGDNFTGQVKVTHIHENGDQDDLGIVTVDSDGFITLTAIQSFSDFQIVPITLNTDDASEYFDMVGGSLRRRIKTSDRVTVVNTSTDIRFTYKVLQYDPNAEYYFQWSLNGNTWSKAVPVKQFDTENSVTLASLVITNVPSSYFDDNFYTRIYVVNDNGTHMLQGEAKSVDYIADKLALNSDNDYHAKWVNYGKYLCGNYGISSYEVIRNANDAIVGHRINGSEEIYDS